MSKRYVIEHPAEDQDRWKVTMFYPVEQDGMIAEEACPEILVGEEELLRYVAEFLLGYSVQREDDVKLLIGTPDPVPESDAVKTTIRIKKPRPGVVS